MKRLFTRTRERPVLGFFQYDNHHLTGLPSVTIGRYYPDGSTVGEFGIDWTILRDRPVPCLVAHDDSWKVLFGSRKIRRLAKLAKQDPSPDEVARVLREAGFVDLTRRVD